MEAAVVRARRERAVVRAVTGATAETDASPRAEAQEEPAVLEALAEKVALAAAELVVLPLPFSAPTPWSPLRATNSPTGAAALAGHLRAPVVRLVHQAM